MLGWYKKSNIHPLSQFSIKTVFSTLKVKYCESDIVSTRFRQIEKLQQHS